MKQNDFSNTGDFSISGKNMKQFKTAYLYRKLAEANMDGNTEAYDDIFARLSQSSRFTSAVSHFVNTHYGYYGVAEMAFVFDEITKEEYEALLYDRLKRSFKKIYIFDLPPVPDNFDEMVNNFTCAICASDVELSALSEVNNAYVRHLQKTISIFAKEWCSQLIPKLAQSRYPGITTQLAKMYVRMRKGTHYTVELSNTNDEIVNAFWDHNPGKLFSWETINHLKEIFGYTPEPEYSDNYIQKKRIVAGERKMNNQIAYAAFVRQTNLKRKSNTEIDKIIKNSFEKVTEFSEDEKVCIAKWFNGCKKSMKPAKKLSKAPVSLIQKYQANGTELLKKVLEDVSKLTVVDPFIRNMAAVGLATV